LSIYVFYFDDFKGLDLAYALDELKTETIRSIGLEKGIVTSEAQQKIMVDHALDEVCVDDIECLIIPGGYVHHLYQNQKLNNFLHAVHEAGKLIVGINNGSLLLASHGLLKGKKCTGALTGINLEAVYGYLFQDATIVNEDVVMDENIMTSTGTGIKSVALELKKHLIR
jgi:putative intracellular protease/amidase